MSKPLAGKAYGSIGHLPGSRVGPGDHHVHAGQAWIATEKARDRHDRIIVTEKLDGSCTAVARINGHLLALGRAGHLAQSSPYEQHQLFAAWVRANESRFDRLSEGERFVGEWLAQAHGTRYGNLNNEPWIVFDCMFQARRHSWDATRECIAGRFVHPGIISDGPAISVAAVLKLLGTYGVHSALDPVEGAVWRVERQGEYDFMAKYVRPDKMDGAYLPEISGKPAIWNWRP